jgi:hypothetical protein
LATAIFLRVRFAGLKTPLLIRVIKKAQLSYVFRETVERDLDRLRSYKLAKVAYFLREGVGRGLSIKLTKVFTGALKNEVANILNSTEAGSAFPHLSAKFWARMALPMLEFNEAIFSSPALLDEFIINVKELSKITAKLMRKSEYRKIEDLVYGLATLVDHDRGVAGKISATGFDDLARKLSERALETTLSFAQCSMDLAFAWVSAASAALGVVREYRRENMDYLAGLCRELANKLDSYMETLDMVVDDELYEDLVRLGVVEKRGL